MMAILSERQLLISIIEKILHDVESTNDRYSSLYRDGITTHPIPFFGNIRSAEVITLGINPSAEEFLPDRGWPEQCSSSYLENRLLNYFDGDVTRHPYFDKWQECLDILGYSYTQNAAHLDLSPRATRSMGGIINKELFMEMIKEDILHLKDLLRHCTKARLILTAGAVTKRYWLYECLKRNFTTPEHGLDLEGDTRRLNGSPWSKMIQLKTPVRQIPLFFTTTGPASRINPHYLKVQIELWRATIIEAINEEE